MIKICREFIFCYLSNGGVNTKQQEVPKNHQVLSIVPSFCFMNLVLSFLVSWVLKTHNKPQDVMHAKGCIENKSAPQTSRSKAAAN